MDSIDWPSGSPETINYKALDIHLSKYQVSTYSHSLLCLLSSLCVHEVKDIYSSVSKSTKTVRH